MTPYSRTSYTEKHETRCSVRLARLASRWGVRESVYEEVWGGEKTHKLELRDPLNLRLHRDLVGSAIDPTAIETARTVSVAIESTGRR